MNNSLKRTKSLFNLMGFSLRFTLTNRSLNPSTRNIVHNNMANNLLDHSIDHNTLLHPQTIHELFSPDSLHLLNMGNLLNSLQTAAGPLARSVENSAIKPWTAITEWTSPSKAATHLLNWLRWLHTPQTIQKLNNHGIWIVVPITMLPKTSRNFLCINLIKAMIV
jgi:hypothetical protein